MSRFDDLTIAVIKPDAVRRRLVGEIITRIQTFARLDIVRMRLLEPDVNLPGLGKWNPRHFYAKHHEGRSYFKDLIAFMSGGPSVGLLLRGPRAIDVWRDAMGPWKGPTNPGEFARWQEETIRGRYMRPNAEPRENLVHGSDSLASLVWEMSCLEDVL